MSVKRKFNYNIRCCRIVYAINSLT